jgi:hypothetical protein
MYKEQDAQERWNKVTTLLVQILQDEEELKKVQSMPKEEYHAYLLDSGFIEEEIRLIIQDLAKIASVRRFPWWLY